MWSKPSLPLLPGPPLPGMVVPVRVLSMVLIEILNHLTVCKQMIVKMNFNVT